jgi:hypothetical protein
MGQQPSIRDPDFSPRMGISEHFAWMPKKAAGKGMVCFRICTKYRVVKFGQEAWY